MGTIRKEELKGDAISGCEFEGCGGGCVIDENGCVNVEKSFRNNREKNSPFQASLSYFAHNLHAIQDINSKIGPLPMNPTLTKLISQYTMPKFSSQFISYQDSNLCEDSGHLLEYDEVTEEEMKSLQDWNFDIFSLKGDLELLHFVEQMLVSLKLPQLFQIKRSVLQEFLLDVQLHYLQNPYHCFTHGVDVMQSTYIFITTVGAHNLSSLEIFAVLLAALCHDIGHPSVSNSFLVNVGAELAMLYNDQSVLENHHCSLTFSLLKAHNLLSGLTLSQQKEFRKIVIHSILGTDMALHCSSHHNKLCDRAPKLIENPLLTSQAVEDRLLICSTILHWADLSNVSRPFHVSRVWCERVTEEFFNQGRIEKKMGLEVKPNMDECKTTCSLNMISFIGTIKDYFDVLGVIFPEMKKYLCLEDNLRQWSTFVW